MPTPLEDALRELAGHQAVRSEIAVHQVDDRQMAVLDVEVSLPSRAQNDVSATGVRRLETVYLVFTPEFPMRAPTPRLRTDFPSNFAHINPHRRGSLVPPCIFEGDLTELMHRFGIEKILDQLLDWLKKAAAGQLLDLEQGWEPTRRGSPETSIEFDADALALSLPHDGSILALPSRLFQVGTSRHLCLGAPGEEPGSFSLARLQATEAWTGTTPVFLACSPWANGQPRVCSEYAADTVVDVPTLLERAESLGISGEALRASLDTAIFRSMMFAASAGNWPWPGDFCLGVVLAAHRPVHLIGSHRSVEFVPYLVRVARQPHRPELRDAKVEPAYQIHRISPRLLAATSGYADADLQQMVTIVGCGSVGSKVALHLGRAGFGAQTLVDDESVSPHNLARHALLDASGWNKAEQTRKALAGLGHQGARAVARDIVPMLLGADGQEISEVVQPATRLFVDTTASLKVAAAVAKTAHLGEQVRVARAFLIGGGRVAVVLLEAPQRAARVDDLYAHLYALCRQNVQLRSAIGGDAAEPTEVFVGDNCRSLTLSMPDSVLSRGSAGIATQVQQWLASGFPKEARLLVGVGQDDDLGMEWQSDAVAPTHVLAAVGDGGWTVRVSGTVAAAISADSQHWTPRETGGALLGHVDVLSRTIYIADLVPAPEDSERYPERFVLGTRGLRAALRQAHGDSVGYLHYVGTWHSHPMGGPHSQTDFDTLQRLASFAPGLPVVSLVWAPTGLLCEVGRFQ
ncbi:thiamine biosynthesis protein ThiF [Ramlibacter sp. RBP-2]|uniref:Thiamine biosynthesis protein ThiF n=1 Tax=Ramlibacter lithotrophicus TaxID=2606681 RepID=A0A7X6I8Q8_9BURK|nr:thiamine biosynthesis protein ThiF [Ramlibacter lithotrophicus]